MSSLRFPFAFGRHPRRPNGPGGSQFQAAAVAAAAATVGIGASLALSLKAENRTDSPLPKPSGRPSPVWASLSLSDASPSGTSVEPRTGAAFPTVIDGTRRLLGIGLRKKSVFGLKNIDVYAFGVYADEADVKKLNEKYGTLPVSELKDNKDFCMNVLDEDIRMTVRLQIVYGRLSISSVRKAFEESVGSRLQKFSQSDNKELLHRFTSIFKDEYKIPRGTLIDLSREPGHILHTIIDGKEVGIIQSKLLCKSLFDLYVGEDPFDRKAKEEFEHGLVSLLQD